MNLFRWLVPNGAISSIEWMRRRSRLLGQTEVDDFDFKFLINGDVISFDIKMSAPVLVYMLESTHNLQMERKEY